MHDVEYRRAYRAAHPEKAREYSRRYREANLEKTREASRKHYWKKREAILARLAAERAADPEGHRERSRAFNKRNPASRSRASQKWYARNKDTVRRRRGLPAPLWDTPQNCECCGCDAASMKRDFHLDHDHVSGLFRGWLCGRCNTAIGALGDSIEGVCRALRYLRRARRLTQSI